MDAHPEFGAALSVFGDEILEQAEIQKKYEGYIRKEREQAEKVKRLDDFILPSTFDYHKVKALSYEGREKLSRTKPNSLGQAEPHQRRDASRYFRIDGFYRAMMPHCRISQIQ